MKLTTESEVRGSMKERYAPFAELLVGYSTKTRRGDVVIIEVFDVESGMVEALIERVHAAGAHPIVWQKSWDTLRTLLRGATSKEIDIIAGAELRQMKQADVYVSIRASRNTEELGGVPDNGLALFQRRWLGPVHYAHRVHHTRWCSAKWPSNTAARAAGMNYETFVEFFFSACLNVDYHGMQEAMKPLVELMQKTDRVKIVGPGTDVEFSIRGIPAVPCAGDRNIPDGEIFTAPVLRSVNGQIEYNVQSAYQGKNFSKVRLFLRDGRIEEFDCADGDRGALSSIFNTDEGSRYIGEFAFGVNPFLTRPINDTMFDEKMTGTIHLTPGNSYRSAFNGNQSSIHWDLVLDQRSSAGGGEIYFDDMLIRRDGLFVLPTLEGLNPSRLGT
jgi:aminopeptidase